MDKKFQIGLKTLREKEGLSQADLAELAGLTKRTIQNLEHRGQNPSWTTLNKLSKALGVPPGLLV